MIETASRVTLALLRQPHGFKGLGPWPDRSGWRRGRDRTIRSVSHRSPRTNSDVVLATAARLGRTERLVHSDAARAAQVLSRLPR